MSGSSWQPLVSGALRDRVCAVADRIAAELRAVAYLPELEPGIAGGAAGLAVALAYHSQVRDSEQDLEAAGTLLQRAVSTANDQAIDPSLYLGLAGVGWAVEHVSGASDEDEIDDNEIDANENIDRSLMDLLGSSPWTGHYDLISGLVGFAVYGLERRSRGRALCDRILELLGQLVRSEPDGLTWFTPAAQLPPDQRAYAPDGYFNLGLAHGVPGIVALLSALATTGDQARRGEARRLLDGAVTWLLAQRLPSTSSSAFAAVSVPGTPAGPARTAWCYGDPGVAASLALAGRAAGMPSWTEAARQLARNAAAQPASESGAGDAALCHGALGLAHIFNRLGHSLADEPLRDAARVWLERGLALERPGEPVAGFPKLDQTAEGRWHWAPDFGLLEGAAGVLLALDAAVSDVEPEWDRIMLLSLR